MADKIAVVPALFDERMNQCERERSIGAGPDLKMNIRLCRDPDSPRVYGDNFHAAFSCTDDVVSEYQRRKARIVAPEEKRFAMREVWSGKIHAEGVTETGIAMPVTDVGRRDPVRAAEGIE